MVSWRQKKTILVVDDEPNLVLALQKRLETAGFKVTSSVCGTEAFRRARAGGIDAITLDVSLLDHVDGLDVAAALHCDPQTAAIPIIFITGRADDEFREKYRTVGGRYFLAKPFDAELLIRMLDSLFAHDDLAEAQRLSSAKRRQPVEMATVE